MLLANPATPDGLKKKIFLLLSSVTRLFLFLNQVEFEDERVDFEEWGAMKPTTMLGQLPILNWDGLEIVQSNTIAR